MRAHLMQQSRYTQLHLCCKNYVSNSFQAVQQGAMSASAAAKLHKVTYRTLKKHLMAVNTSNDILNESTEVHNTSITDNPSQKRELATPDNSEIYVSTNHKQKKLSTQQQQCIDQLLTDNIHNNNALQQLHERYTASRAYNTKMFDELVQQLDAIELKMKQYPRCIDDTGTDNNSDVTEQIFEHLRMSVDKQTQEIVRHMERMLTSVQPMIGR
jgi:hypothetical protein